MQEKYFMKRWELSTIILNLTTYKIFTGYPRIFAEISGSAAHITAICSGAAAFLVIYLMLTLYKKAGNKTIINLAEERLGSWAKYVIFIILFVYFICSIAITLRETGEFIKAVAFPTAPLLFVFLFIVVAALCCARGFDAIGRTHSIIIPVSVAVTVLVIIFALPGGRVSNLAPWLGYGAGNTFIKGLSSIGLYGDLIILFMLAPFAASGTQFKKTALLSAAAGIIINIAVIFVFTMTAPYEVLKTVIHPVYQLVKLFSAGSFLRRIDGYFMYITAGCAILHLSIVLFFAAYTAKQTFSLEKSRPLAYPLSAVAVFLAALPESRETLYLLSKNTLWAWFIIIFAAALIVLAAGRRRDKTR